MIGRNASGARLISSELRRRPVKTSLYHLVLSSLVVEASRELLQSAHSRFLRCVAVCHVCRRLLVAMSQEPTLETPIEYDL